MYSGELERLENLVSQGLVLPEDAEKYKRVLGKPSQFVGQVLSIEDAALHWKELSEWEVQEADRIAQLSAALGKPAHKPPTDQQKVDRRFKHTPESRALIAWKKERLESANAEWRKAIIDRDTNLEKVNAYIAAEKKRLKELLIDQTKLWNDHVRKAKSVMDELK